MADLPARPPGGLAPLPEGWTEHKAPSGHTYYYNKETKKSTYTRPVADLNHLHGFQARTHPVPTSAPSLAPDSTSNAYGSFAESSAFGAQNSPSGFGAQNTFNGALGYNNFSGAPGYNNFNTPPPQNTFHFGTQHHSRGPHRGGHNNFPDRRRSRPEDRPKHRTDIPNCAPWVLVRTKLGRRFVWNKDTNESFWKFPPEVMKAVIEYDRMEREKKERQQREDDDTMAEVEAEVAAAEAEVQEQIVEVEGDADMDDDEEYEEVEVTDDEGEEHASKRQRTEEDPPATEQDPDQPMEMGEEDIAWQLAQMEELEAMNGAYGNEEEEEEGLPLTEEDCKALFKELLDDLHTSPYTPWDKLLENTALYDDERYKALPNMKSRKDCFDEWCKEKAQYLKEQKASQKTRDPRIPYLAFLHTHATPKLYWPEFRRKFKKEPEMRDTKVADKEKERLYREHIKRLALPSSTQKSDLSALLKAQPLASLNRNSTLETLPDAILTDLRYITLPASVRDSLVETYISTLPPAPEGAGAASAEEVEAARKKKEERVRREKALAERERRVREEKRKQEREIAYGKGRLREEEDEIERAMRVGKGGLRGHLDE